MSTKIVIGCDHAGYPYKTALAQHLQNKGYTIEDKGTHAADSVDYPDFIHPTAQAVENGQAQFGIILCGSGNGAAMTANKYPHVRAAIAWNQQLARLARQHNNANILSIPTRFVSEAIAIEMVDTFLTTSFEGGRHARRVQKIPIS